MLTDDTKAALEAGSCQGKAAARAADPLGQQPGGERLEARPTTCSTTTSTSSRSAPSTHPEWKIADPQVRIAERAVAALAGLWGNHGYDRCCPRWLAPAADDVAQVSRWVCAGFQLVGNAHLHRRHGRCDSDVLVHQQVDEVAGGERPALEDNLRSHRDGRIGRSPRTGVEHRDLGEKTVARSDRHPGTRGDAQA